VPIISGRIPITPDCLNIIINNMIENTLDVSGSCMMMKRLNWHLVKILMIRNEKCISEALKKVEQSVGMLSDS